MKTIIVSLATVLAAGVAAAQPADGLTAYRSTVLGDTSVATTGSTRVAAVSSDAAYRRFITGAPLAQAEQRNATQTSGYEAYRRTVLGQSLADAGRSQGTKS
jgi:hypothetical protein